MPGFTSPQLDLIIAAGAGGIPTTALWTEIKTLLNNAYGAIVGSVTLNSTAGATETFSDIGTVDYDVFYWIESGGTPGAIGEITIEIVDATSFTVYNSGSDTTSTLHYRIIKQ